MKFQTLDGKIIAVQLSRKALCRYVVERSEGQYNLYNLLKEIYGPTQIFEEFIIPGEKLSLDFFIPRNKMAFEFHGDQHYNMNRFFHTDHNDFLKQKERDVRKLEWCKINHVTLVEIQDKHISLMKLKEQIIEAIRKQNNC